MSTLIENLHNNNVIFSYYGFIDEKVLGEVLQITKSKLEGNQENPQTVGRVHDAINECVDNVIKHNFYPADDQIQYKSLLVVSKKEDDYLIDTINVVNATQKNRINEQLSYLNSRTKEELHTLKSQSILNQTNTALMNKGFIDLVLKADNCDCTFKDLDANSLFNINFKIHSSN
jgi:hypothetical protein